MVPRLLLADGHADTLYAALKEGRDWTRAARRGQTDLVRFEQAGIGLQVLALFSDPAHGRWGFTAKALEMAAAFFRGRDEANTRGHRVGLVLCRDDVARLAREAETEAGCGFNAVLAIEGCEALSGSLGVLEAFYRLGVRSLGLVWNHRNELADGVADGSSGGGLTPFGREVVRAANRLGMAVDVSHLSEAGFWDVVRTSRAPIFASHSNAYALCPHSRNLTDDQVRAIAETGGVIGVNFYESFLVETGPAGPEDVWRHIEYLAGLVGPAHVAFGTDYDGISRPPAGLEDVTRLPSFIEFLRHKGVGDDDLRAIAGRNLARFFESVLPRP